MNRGFRDQIRIEYFIFKFVENIYVIERKKKNSLFSAPLKICFLL